MPGAKTRLHLLGPLTQDQTHINVGKCLGRLSDRPLAAPQTRFVSCIYYTSLPCTPTNFNISWFERNNKKKCLSNQKLPRQPEVSFLIPYNHHTKHLPFTNIVNITFVVFYQKKKKKERLRRLQGCSYCVKLQGILFVQRKMRKDLSLPLINNTHFSLASHPRIKNGCVWCSTNQTGT